MNATKSHLPRLNALLTALEAAKMQKRVHYTALELNPVSKQNVRLLNYTKILENSSDHFERIHEAN